MRVLLAAAPHRDTFGYSMPPPGLLRLGGAFRAAGIEVALEDLAYRLGAGELAADDALAERSAELLLARQREGALGLSVMGATLPIALAILEHVRRAAPELSLWLGGPGTTGIDRELVARFACVDVVVRGEGERTGVELAQRLSRSQALDGLPGITWRARDGRVVREAEREPLRDLGELPPYAWDLLPPIAHYKRITGEEDGLVPVDSGRGCVYDCSFCTIGRYWGRRSRVLPAPRLAEEIAALGAIEGARQAYLCHDIFGANRAHALALCEELTARGSRVPWEVRARADHLDRELLARMGRAGCYRVLLGIESGDAAVREKNQKGMRGDVDLLQVVDDCAAAGIVPILSLILGLPGEDEAALRASLDFCAAAALRSGVQISLHLVNPQPGCALGEEFGARARALEGIPPDMALGAGESAPERALIAAHPDLFTTWTLLPDAEEHLRFLHRLASELPEVLMRYPRTFARVGATNGGLDVLDTWRAWKAHGGSFEKFALARGDAAAGQTLAWEQAQVRAAARGSSRSSAQRPGPRSRAELLRLTHDVTAASCPPAPTTLAVVAVDRGVRTLRISEDVANLLARLDGQRSAAELETAHPGIGAALETLKHSGLVETDPR